MSESEINLIKPAPDFESIKRRADEINPQNIADELLDWLDANVENYIDNSKTIFRIYFPKEELVDIPHMLRLHELYAESKSENKEDSEVEAQCLNYLHAVVTQAKECMKKSRVKIEKLFRRLIFYYEMKLAHDQAGMRTVEFEYDGTVSIVIFDYEPYSVDIEVKRGYATGDGPVQGQEIIEKKTLPEGYALEFKLVYWPATASTGVIF